jgi:hypothetical protein
MSLLVCQAKHLAEITSFPMLQHQIDDLFPSPRDYAVGGLLFEVRVQGTHKSCRSGWGRKTVLHCTAQCEKIVGGVVGKFALHYPDSSPTTIKSECIDPAVTRSTNVPPIFPLSFELKEFAHQMLEHSWCDEAK